MVRSSFEAAFRTAIVCAACFAFAGCSTARYARTLPLGDSVMVPIGRTCAGQTEIFVNGRAVAYDTRDDGFGGTWAVIPSGFLEARSELSVRYTRDAAVTPTIGDAAGETERWLAPSNFIDSEHPEIRAAARRIIDPSRPVASNVRRASDFVIATIEFDMDFSRAPAVYRASQTLADGIGVCINFARLFTAICRAGGIPARTVSGIVQGWGNPDCYDFHHEWAEYRDEAGIWRQMDMTYIQSLELADVRYLDLVYSAEDNPWFAGLDNRTLASGLPLRLDDGSILLFAYHPVFPGARYGFEIVEYDGRGRAVLEKTIVLRRFGPFVRIEQRLES